MIYGLGTDTVNIERIAGVMAKFEARFLERTFTETEQQAIAAETGELRRNARVAKLFAAKEAAVKALGTGFRDGISWREIEVSHDPWGKPLLKFRGKAAEKLAAAAGEKTAVLHLSLSDDYPMAAAVVIIEF